VGADSRSSRDNTSASGTSGVELRRFARGRASTRSGACYARTRDGASAPARPRCAPSGDDTGAPEFARSTVGPGCSHTAAPDFARSTNGPGERSSAASDGCPDAPAADGGSIAAATPAS
jgi:hypothetical protein